MNADKTAATDLPTLFDPETCVRKGLCPVSSIRNKGDPFEKHSLYFEQHGNGPEKIIFIMGSFAWAGQVEYFGRIPRYSVLVFDNRGVGNSSAPRGPYTTSGMAEDTITLLNYVGWTEHRDLHVVAVSLGGMIGQELAYRIPERIISLTLAVTTAGGKPWNNFPPNEDKIPMIHDMVFPREWLDAKAEDDPQGRTNREVQSEIYRKRMDVTRPQTFMGTISQMAAGLTHYMSPDRLRRISKSVPKVLILTGDEDHLVRPSNSIHLKQHMPEAELVEWERTGHGIHVQWKKRFNDLLERVFEEGRQRVEDFAPEL
ncbi:hypothetical protein NM688_g69 [Phlebia brevispora]|uniref:Uncharacterized protein n=1 Tax=Phlebia brevispora TaxID=194682 RepID=A0ACC1TFL1_9APHY|nr:hypothetical protein NM688_g69 [Phlebia brevispora]